MADPAPKVAIGKTRFSASCCMPERTSARRRGAATAWLVCLIAACLSCEAAADRSCGPWQAELVSVEGTVEVKRPQGWQRAASGAALCMGDSLRVAGYSRAAIRLPDKTVLRLDAHTSLTFAQPQDDTGSWLEVLRGVIHVISRDPRALRFNTPYANAGLEGTEFVIGVADGRTDVTVLEGEVLLSNAAGTVAVPSGQRGSASLAQGLRAEPAPDPIAAIGWTTYYVPILGDALPGAEQPPTATEAASPDFYARRAARRMSAGKIVEAGEDLERALALDARHGKALALQALIALGRKNLDEALRLSGRAIALSPQEPAAWLARSYAMEASFDLTLALRAAETAADLDPREPLARARTAELRLAAGDSKRARAAAEQALALTPDAALAHAVLGFAALGGASSSQAEAHFRRAVTHEPAAPLARLGLGLALVRQGRLEAGREQMEIAVVLDPTSALSRSYMAKIYDAERRSALGGAQLELAKALGERDPTAWYYDALLKQNENRPVEALHDLQTAVDLNDGRAVYRSRLRLDEDLAARSAAVGRLHRTLGFEQLALLEGWKSVIADPADYSGHRLLADVYSHLPRHQIARVNELYQSELLQPLNLTPIRPQLAEPNLFILDTAGPSALAFDEFRPLVQQNGLSFVGSGVTAGNATQGVDVAVAGLHDRVSYSVGYFDFATDGFRLNNDLDQRIANALVQLRPNARTSILSEIRSTETEKGDLRSFFLEDSFDPSLRQLESVDSLRIGVRRDLDGPGLLLASFIAEQAQHTSALTVGSPTGSSDSHFAFDAQRDGFVAGLKHLHYGDRWRAESGFRYSRHTEIDTASLLGAPIGASVEEFQIEHATGYVYASRRIGPRLETTLGLSVDDATGQLVSERQINPKLGVIWTLSARTTMRAAAFRGLQGPFLSKHNVQPSLEPTHVAGFNQQFFGPEGEESWRYGIGVDHRFSSALHAGVELSRRDLKVPLLTVSPESLLPVLEHIDADEAFHRAYVYWAPSPRISTSIEYQYEWFDRTEDVPFDGVFRARTHKLPLSARYFHPSGFTAGTTLTYVDQAGAFGFLAPGQGVATQPGDDDFWVADLSLGYRLPSRRGQISLNVHNALDKAFRFQDSDPENPRILPERMVLARITLSY